MDPRFKNALCKPGKVKIRGCEFGWSYSPRALICVSRGTTGCRLKFSRVLLEGSSNDWKRLKCPLSTGGGLSLFEDHQEQKNADLNYLARSIAEVLSSNLSLSVDSQGRKIIQLPGIGEFFVTLLWLEQIMNSLFYLLSIFIQNRSIPVITYVCNCINVL